MPKVNKVVAVAPSPYTYVAIVNRYNNRLIIFDSSNLAVPLSIPPIPLGKISGIEYFIDPGAGLSLAIDILVNSESCHRYVLQHHQRVFFLELSLNARLMQPSISTQGYSYNQENGCMFQDGQPLDSRRTLVSSWKRNDHLLGICMLRYTVLALARTDSDAAYVLYDSGSRYALDVVNVSLKSARRNSTGADRFGKFYDCSSTCVKFSPDGNLAMIFHPIKGNFLVLNLTTRRVINQGGGEDDIDFTTESDFFVSDGGMVAALLISGKGQRRVRVYNTRGQSMEFSVGSGVVAVFFVSARCYLASQHGGSIIFKLVDIKIDLHHATEGTSLVSRAGSTGCCNIL